VNRFQKLAALTLATALGLVTIGVIVRATDSGLGCPDWPLCHGQLIPAIDDARAWIEWIHRTVAAIIGGVGGLIGLAVAVIMIFSLWKIFEKAGKPGWAAIVPMSSR